MGEVFTQYPAAFSYVGADFLLHPYLYSRGKRPRDFTRLAQTFLQAKTLPTTFLPSVKTFTKNVIFVFLLAQVFFL
ncbi:MAG: hypothetical protein WBE22_05680 [Halobacteriota archaeon]